MVEIRRAKRPVDELSRRRQSICKESNFSLVLYIVRVSQTLCAVEVLLGNRSHVSFSMPKTLTGFGGIERTKVHGKLLLLRPTSLSFAVSRVRIMRIRITRHPRGGFEAAARFEFSDLESGWRAGVLAFSRVLSDCRTYSTYYIYSPPQSVLFLIASNKKKLVTRK